MSDSEFPGPAASQFRDSYDCLKDTARGLWNRLKSASPEERKAALEQLNEALRDMKRTARKAVAEADRT